MSTALEEAPVAFVQEPEDLPKWVFDYEQAYITVVDHFILSQKNYKKVYAFLSTQQRHIGLSSIPISADFDELNKFINRLVDAVIEECEREFAPRGAKLTIDKDCIPKKLITKLSYKGNNEWNGDPREFKVSEIYKFLDHKYHTSSTIDLVAQQAADELVKIIGLGPFNYNNNNAIKKPEFHNENGTVKPFVERFDKAFKRTKHAVVYQLSMIEGYSSQSGIIWNMDSTRSAQRMIAAFRGVCSLIFHGVKAKYDAFDHFLNVLEKSIERIHAGSGGVYQFGHEHQIEDYRYIFRKKALELHVPHDMHERIVKFVGLHISLKKGS